MVSLEYRTYEEIKDRLPAIFEEVFGYWDIYHIPGYVLLVYVDGEYAGFLSCHDQSATTVYLQYCGFTEKYRNNLSIRLFKQIVAELHHAYPVILGRIWNENVKALQVALFSGFKVIGARQATDGKLYLEILKVKEN